MIWSVVDLNRRLVVVCRGVGLPIIMIGMLTGLQVRRGVHGSSTGHCCGLGLRQCVRGVGHTARLSKHCLLGRGVCSSSSSVVLAHAVLPVVQLCSPMQQTSTNECVLSAATALACVRVWLDAVCGVSLHTLTCQPVRPCAHPARLAFPPTHLHACRTPCCYVY